MDEMKMREILKDYQFKRDRKNDELKKRLEFVYKKFPDIKEVSDEIVKVGLEMTKLAVFNSLSDNERGDASDIEKKLMNLEIKQDSLIERKNELLKNYNIPEGYLDIKYDCVRCKDTGFLDNGKKCNCLRQTLINDAYNNSNMMSLLKEQNFDTFNLEVFSDFEVDGVNVREQMKEFLSDMFAYSTSFPNVKNLPFLDGKENIIFVGKAGLGKTFLCSCVAKQLLDKGFTVVYQTAFELMEAIEKYKFRRDSYSSVDEKRYDSIFNCDLLIIDDLGTEMPNSFTISEIFNVINTRILNNKNIIISTNLSLKDMNDTYTDRVVSRIIGYFKPYYIVGEDLRFKNFG